MIKFESRSSAIIVSDYGLDDQGSFPNQSRGFFLPTLRPTQHSNDGYRRSFGGGKKAAGAWR